jgi:transcriptional regulator with XRE-family HTH domain
MLNKKMQRRRNLQLPPVDDEWKDLFDQQKKYRKEKNISAPFFLRKIGVSDKHSLHYLYGEEPKLAPPKKEGHDLRVKLKSFLAAPQDFNEPETFDDIARDLNMSSKHPPIDSVRYDVKTKTLWLELIRKDENEEIEENVSEEFKKFLISKDARYNLFEKIKLQRWSYCTY